MAVTNTETAETAKVARLPEELVNSTAFLLKRLGFVSKDRSLAAYDAMGLHPYHHAVLAVLDEGPPDTQASIADTLGYDRGQLVGLLDELEEKGLLERRRDPDDRRRHIVSLTPAGKRTLAKLRATAGRLEDELLAPLSAAEREQLHTLLRKLAEQHLPQCSVLPRS
jgi:MarR family transcriptional regulator, lower aerobic nicotinate degradation pathway regulator